MKPVFLTCGSFGSKRVVGFLAFMLFLELVVGCYLSLLRLIWVKAIGSRGIENRFWLGGTVDVKMGYGDSVWSIMNVANNVNADQKWAITFEVGSEGPVA